MKKEFRQITWDDEVMDDCRQLARLAVREDLSRGHDLTTVALTAPEELGRAAIVARQEGVIAGLRAAEVVLDEMQIDACWTPLIQDGARVERGAVLVEWSGAARDLLTAERILLNFLGRLSGVATQTSAYVTAIRGTKARIYDTRKTTPGWRRLEKYAVHCGGGTNHRTGLFDAVLIKDNHLAFGATSERTSRSPAEAVQQARVFLREMLSETQFEETIIEVEVDTLSQFHEVLAANPDVVLLDNMTCDQLREAVVVRDKQAPRVSLEASGGVNLSTVRAIAETGVDRISVGALTHSAVNFDVSMDWR